MPKVSIIISTYNRDEFLNKTLTSLRLQTFKIFEVLVCDDGGTTGNTNKITEKFNKFYPIKYFWRENKEDYGLAATRNMGAKNAQGEFLFFLDGDMVLLPETIERMHSWLTKYPWRKYKYHVVPQMRKHISIDVDENLILNDFNRIKDYIIKGFSKKYEGISPGGGGMIWKNVYEKIGGFDDILFSNLVLEDIEFIYRLEAFLGHKTKRLLFYMYHLDNRSIRSDREIKSRHNEKLAQEILIKKFKAMGFVFQGKRPKKDLKNHSHKYYRDLLDNKEIIKSISKKLKKEVIDNYQNNIVKQKFEKEYLNQKISDYQPLVYIIVLNYNGLDWLKLCIPSLLKTNYQNYKILVVDNNSNDDGINYIKTNFSQVEILPLDKNYGYAGGNNKGMRYALKRGAEYIAVLNNDTTVDPEWLSKLVDFGEAHFDAGALGPLILNGDGSKIQGPMMGFNQPTYLDLNEKQYKEPKIVGKLVGCAILFKRKALEKVGYFDKSFFCYQEEYDWCQRARYHNFNLYIVPSSKIRHYGFQTSAKKRDYIYYKMKYLYTHNEIKRILKDPSKPIHKLLKYVIFKNFFTRSKDSRNFFLYYFSLFNNLILLPKTILRRNKDIRGY